MILRIRLAAIPPGPPYHVTILKHLRYVINTKYTHAQNESKPAPPGALLLDPILGRGPIDFQFFLFYVE